MTDDEVKAWSIDTSFFIAQQVKRGIFNVAYAERARRRLKDNTARLLAAPENERGLLRIHMGLELVQEEAARLTTPGL